MSSSRLIAILILISISNTVEAAEWREYGPPGGAVTALVGNVSDTLHYAVCSQDCYRSFDQGANWMPLPPAPDPFESFQDAVLVGDVTQTLLVLKYTGGVLRWDASEEVWVPSNLGIDPPPSGYALQCFDIAIASPTSERVFLGCSTGLYYSDNSGRNWNKIVYPNPNYFPSRINPATDGSLYIYTYTPIRIESNLVDTAFFVAKPGLPSRALVGASIWPSPDNPNDLLLVFPDYPAYGNASYYWSTDRGENWTPASMGSKPVTPLSVLWEEGQPSVVSATGFHDLDLGTLNWSQRWDFFLRTHWNLKRLPGEGTWLRGSTDRGVWKTVNGGATWEYSSQGMGAYGEMRGVVPHPSDPDSLWAGFATSGIWKTVDDGETWFSLNQGMEPDPAYNLSIRSFAMDPGNPMHLLAGLESSYSVDHKLYRSLDGGANWSLVQQAPPFLVENILFSRSSPGTVLLGTLGGGVWRSTDGGATFESNAAFPQYSNITDIAEETGGRLFACQTATFNTQGGVFISDNHGQSWTVDESQGGFLSMVADAVSPGRVMAGYGAGGLKFTSNNGASWTAVNNGIPTSYGGYPEATSLLADTQVSGTYYLALEGFGLYRTTNEGAEWTPLNPTKREVEAVDGPMALSDREGGTLFAGNSIRGVVFTQLEQPIVDPTPTPTWTPSPDPSAQATATFTPPPGFPPKATPSPTTSVVRNVAVEPRTLSVTPKSPATGTPVSVGVTLYNDSQTPLTNVGVACYWSREGGAPVSFSSFSVPNLIARNWLEIPVAGSFTPNQEGTYTVQVVVDPANNLEEDIESDNSDTASFYVRQAGVDSTPPSGSIVVAGGSPFTTLDSVGIQFNASDTGTGVGYIWLTAYHYDAWSGALNPFWDSGWAQYVSNAQLPIIPGWTGDITTFAVNYADLDGNISPTYWGTVTYNQTDFTEFVLWDELVFYPFYLEVGQTASITLHNIFGDADLFVISPVDPPGTYTWGSQTDGIGSENLLINGFVDGIYWIAVFGYDFSEYQLLCGGSSKAGDQGHPGTFPSVERRAPNLDAPLTGNTPVRGIAVPSIGIDYNSDGAVDSTDLFHLCKSWGAEAGMPTFDARVSGLGAPDKIGAGHLLKWIRFSR
jgi:hypothetical protein